MKQSRLKRYTVRFGIAFFAVLALLTYFSETIDNMLLPKVKVAEISKMENDDPNAESVYYVPLSAIAGFGNSGSVFKVTAEENGDLTVTEIIVNIVGEDDLFYEVKSDFLYNGMELVYSTSKELTNGDRVYVEEE